MSRFGQRLESIELDCGCTFYKGECFTTDFISMYDKSRREHRTVEITHCGELEHIGKAYNAILNCDRYMKREECEV